MNIARFSSGQAPHSTDRAKTFRVPSWSQHFYHNVQWNYLASKGKRFVGLKFSCEQRQLEFVTPLGIKWRRDVAWEKEGMLNCIQGVLMCWKVMKGCIASWLNWGHIHAHEIVAVFNFWSLTKRTVPCRFGSILIHFHWICFHHVARFGSVCPQLEWFHPLHSADDDASWWSSVHIELRLGYEDWWQTDDTSDWTKCNKYIYIYHMKYQ